MKPLVILVVAASIAGSAIAGLLIHDARQRAIGAAAAQTEIVLASKKEGAARARKSAKVRDAAAAPGALDRLRKDRASCVDCQ